jgi:hypothetical protein
MRNKMIKHGIAVIGIAIFIFLSVASASSPDSLSSSPEDYLEVHPDKLYEYMNPSFWDDKRTKFIIETRLYVARFSDIIQGETTKPIELLDAAYRTDTMWAHIKDSNESLSLIGERIETDKVYRVYISFVYITGEREPFLIIDQIDGLMPIEEAQARVAQREEAQRQAQAEREAAEAARRQAIEEANRYDPAKFIIVPSYFRPTDYTSADLFTAVAASERLSIYDQYYFGVNWGPPSRSYVSEVIFVSQNGTDIIFRTADNAISKRMKVASRTGLTAGQRVRIYYTVYRIEDWQVAAIERL